MGQMGFFDVAKRYADLDAKDDPLSRIDEVVRWEAFRPRLEAAWRRSPEERKSPAGRKPWDAVVMFKAIGTIRWSTSSGTVFRSCGSWG
jgi:hypothetical protein